MILPCAVTWDTDCLLMIPTLTSLLGLRLMYPIASTDLLWTITSMKPPCIWLNSGRLLRFNMPQTELWTALPPPLHICSIYEGESRSVVSNSLWPHRLYRPRNSPGQNTGVGSHSFLQGIFPSQGWNPGLPRCRWFLYCQSQQGSPDYSWVSILKFTCMYGSTEAAVKPEK